MAYTVDLHTHSTASDGALTPAQLVELALARGLRVLALTDHDSTGGIAEAVQAAVGTPLNVIPGVELSCELSEGEIHILGYWIDDQNPELQTLLKTLRDSRFRRGQRMVEKLAELGMPLDWEEVLAQAGDGAVGRPHVAKALVERGYVADVRTAFDLYLANGRPAHISRYKVAPAEAIALIRRMGGVPVFAHPTYTPDYAGWLPAMIAAGLAGLEVYYADYPLPVILELLSLCQQYDLVPTGGSDFHGGGVKEGVDLGQAPVPAEVVPALAARRQQHG